MVTVAQPTPTLSPRFPAVRHLGPNWYACVMGTDAMATAGTALPWHPPGLRTLCTAFWALSLLLLTALLTARSLHWRHHRDRARAHLADPAAAPFYGCLAMALTATAGATLTVGKDWTGTTASVALGAALFTAGTVTALAAAVTVPYLMAVRHRVDPATATPVWLLPLVAPMVSAAVGPLLVPHLPPGLPARTLLLGCLTLFGASLLAVLAVLRLIVGRLLTGDPLPLALTPTLFLVLGPLGQSTTATAAIADAARGTAPGATALRGFAVLYGMPVMGFALLWLCLATAHVVRARRAGMGFSMTWWAFTFPVGTCVTGAAALARHTGLAAYDVLALALYAALAAAWAVAAAHTARGVVSGALLRGPGRAPVERRPVTARTR
ncbi:TDT family transporter [Streptomyces sp. NPDC003717]|uniref:TDT family transporter n=1 Tax=Streptomyces sp. NPDC003717 TaxID=3154276 RepID=UPI0033A66863